MHAVDGARTVDPIGTVEMHAVEVARTTLLPTLKTTLVHVLASGLESFCSNGTLIVRMRG
jgi:hypothetical protein